MHSCTLIKKTKARITTLTHFTTEQPMVPFWPVCYAGILFVLNNKDSLLVQTQAQALHACQATSTCLFRHSLLEVIHIICNAVDLCPQSTHLRLHEPSCFVAVQVPIVFLHKYWHWLLCKPPKCELLLSWTSEILSQTHAVCISERRGNDK